MKGIQTPLVEVLMFVCWAFIPYYICDGVDWSGIVAIVAAGFFMDVYVIGTRREQEHSDLVVGMLNSSENPQSNMVTSRKRTMGIFSQEGFLSAKAKNHIGFVTEINSTLMETAIFAYLGIFLLNKRYHWNFTIPLVAVISCIFSRAIMVAFSSAVSNTITRVCHIGRKSLQNNCVSSSRNLIPSSSNESNNKNAGVIIDSRMQVVLIFAGLRGAMSFALVETVPMYDQSTGEGSRYKPELKAMTSACIVFTVFVLGGYTYYLLVRLGLGPVGKDEESFEMVSLINNGANVDKDEEEAPWAGKDSDAEGPHRRKRIICPDTHSGFL
jgi:NhaP-type Na+/H+ or K+/H+ antiporter